MLTFAEVIKQGIPNLGPHLSDIELRFHITKGIGLTSYQTGHLISCEDCRIKLRKEVDAHYYHPATAATTNHMPSLPQHLKTAA